MRSLLMLPKGSPNTSLDGSHEGGTVVIRQTNSTQSTGTSTRVVDEDTTLDTKISY